MEIKLTNNVKIIIASIIMLFLLWTTVIISHMVTLPRKVLFSGVVVAKDNQGEQYRIAITPDSRNEATNTDIKVSMAEYAGYKVGDEIGIYKDYRECNDDGYFYFVNVILYFVFIACVVIAGAVLLWNAYLDRRIFL